MAPPRRRAAQLSSKRLRHRTLGELELDHVVLQVADQPEQKIITFAPSSEDRARIAELLRVGDP